MSINAVFQQSKTRPGVGGAACKAFEGARIGIRAAGEGLRVWRAGRVAKAVGRSVVRLNEKEEIHLIGKAHYVKGIGYKKLRI